MTGEPRHQQGPVEERTLQEVRLAALDSRSRLRQGGGFFVSLGLAWACLQAMFWLRSLVSGALLGVLAFLLLMVGSALAGIALAEVLLVLQDLWYGSGRFVLDEEGFEDRALRLGKIPWEDILGVERAGPFGAHLLLDLRDPERYLARLEARWIERATSSFSRWVIRKGRRSPFLVNLLGTGISPTAMRADLLRRAAGIREVSVPRVPEETGKTKAEDSASEEDVVSTREWLEG